MDEVTAQASEAIRREFPKRPTFLVLHYTYSDGYWVASTPDNEDTPQSIIEGVKDNYYADIVMLVHIPGEAESAYLKRRAELLEELVQSVAQGIIAIEEIDGLRLVVEQIRTLDAEWKEAQGA